MDLLDYDATLVADNEKIKIKNENLVFLTFWASEVVIYVFEDNYFTL